MSVTNKPHNSVPILQAVCDCTGGEVKVKRKDYAVEGKIPVIDQGQEYIAGYTKEENKYKGTLPVILFGDHTRIFKYVDFTFALGADGVKVLQPQDGFDALFLYYFFRYIDLPNAGYSRHFKFLKEIQVFKPPLPEQHRIVDVLSRAEGIVRLRRAAEKKAAELIPALFLEMFGDPVSNPKGWELKPLRSIVEIGSGNGFPISFQGKTVGMFPFYKVSDMNKKGNEFEMIAANNYLDENDLKIIRAKLYPKGAVIFPKIGAAITTNKKRILTRPSCVDNNVMCLATDNHHLSIFLHALLQSKNLSDFASESNPPSIRKSTVEEWHIPLPPISKLADFSLKVTDMRVIQSHQSAATAQAEAVFAALLAQAFAPA